MKIRGVAAHHDRSVGGQQRAAAVEVARAVDDVTDRQQRLDLLSLEPGQHVGEALVLGVQVAERREASQPVRCHRAQHPCTAIPSALSCTSAGAHAGSDANFSVTSMSTVGGQATSCGHVTVPSPLSASAGSDAS